MTGTQPTPTGVQQAPSDTPTPATAAAAAAAQQHGQQSPAAPGQRFTPPASQEDLDRIIGERLARERAKFVDYDDLKAKATKYDEAEAKNKTEAERLADELAKARQRAADLERDAVRARVAATAGLPVELITGATEDECQAQATAITKLLADRTSSPPWGGQVGSTPSTGGTTVDPIRAFIDSRR